MNWPTVNRPKDLGGLGVLDLKKFASALRLRWLWQEWKEPNKPWVGLGTLCSDKDKLLFAATTTIQIGSGAKTSFWHSAWIQGRRPKDIAPTVFNISMRKNRTVQEALTNNNWVRDIDLGAQLSVTHIQQFILLWNLVATVPVTPDADDHISWKLTQSGMYSVSSAYRAQFFGHTGRNPCPLIWKPWAPPKCKFFAWLVMRNRVWTSDRLATRGWPRNDC